MPAFQTADWIAVVAYFLVLLGITWWSMKQKQNTSADYFLASRHVGWFVVGASIFASNIGAEHIVGLAGTAAKIGRGHGPLRAPRLARPGPGLVLHPVLHAEQGLHHARVPGAPLLPERPLVPVRHHA